MKKMIVLVLAAAMLLTLCACGSKAKDVDYQALTEELKNKVSFESEMTAVSEEQIGFMMAEMPVKFNAAGYGATGSTAEEILVVKCESADDAKIVESSMKAHLAELTDQANKYDPAAVSRIENAVLTTGSNVVVLCITDDTATAESVIKGYLG